MAHKTKNWVKNQVPEKLNLELLAEGHNSSADWARGPHKSPEDAETSVV